MKQEIVCQKCEIKLHKLFPYENPYPGEHVKFVNGEALKDFRCDQCDDYIEKGQLVIAFSIWADYGGVPYYPWEKDFIKI